MGFWDFQHIYNEQWPEYCAWCGVALEEVMEHPENSMGDHWLPRSKGGAHATLPCCPNCNSTRGNKTPLEFLRYCRDYREEDLWLDILDCHHGGKNELSRMVHKVRDE